MTDMPTSDALPIESIQLDDSVTELISQIQLDPVTTEDMPELESIVAASPEFMVDVQEIMETCTSIMSSTLDGGERSIALCYLGGKSTIGTIVGMDEINVRLQATARNAKHLYSMKQGLFIKRSDDVRDFWKVTYISFQLPGEVLYAKNKEGIKVRINNPLGCLTETEVTGFCYAVCEYVEPDNVLAACEEVSQERIRKLCAVCGEDRMWKDLPMTTTVSGVTFHFCNKKCWRAVKDSDLEGLAKKNRTEPSLVEITSEPSQDKKE